MHTPLIRKGELHGNLLEAISTPLDLKAQMITQNFEAILQDADIIDRRSSSSTTRIRSSSKVSEYILDAFDISFCSDLLVDIDLNAFFLEMLTCMFFSFEVTGHNI